MIKSLSIKNFRSLENFKVSKLGLVNLVVGKNNSGKSSVLEALRIYAANGQRSLLEKIASTHDEKFRITESEFEDTKEDLPFQDFFTGRQFPEDDNAPIEIGELESDDFTLRIEHGLLIEIRESTSEGDGETRTRINRRRVKKSENRTLLALTEGIPIDALFISKGDKISISRLDERNRARFVGDLPMAMPCSVIPTQFISVDELADEWDKIGLTNDKQIVQDALKIIAPEFEELMFVKTEDSYPDPRYPARRSSFSRTAMVRMSNFSKPVPLSSLGDGMLRILQLIIKIFSAKDGFFLIDEFENGLHYSVQEKVWKLVFELAEKLNIQVFATTHSWDCIESFAKVAIEKKNIEGVLFRVGRSVKASEKDRVIATVFNEEQLENLTQADVEVR